ncbi:MAG: TSUP family transporter [Myxococcaceae bacterium]
MGIVQWAAICAAAFAAGWVDAIAGGGGLITVPSLLAIGLPPHLALGTNKGQSVFGALAALIRFARAGWIDAGRARFFFLAGLLGAWLGSTLVLRLHPEVLKPVILGLLVAAGLFMAIRRPRAGVPAETTVKRADYFRAVAAALAIGTYDGFFGPGTGTFLIVAFTALMHLPIARASAEAKVVNFASNLAALGLFAARGVVVWPIALPMAACQWLGGTVGAHYAVRRGDTLVRWVVLAVVTALAAKLAVDLIR